MKRWIFLLVLLTLVCAYSPQARSEVFMDYDFSAGIVWQIGGFEVYDIMQRGEVVGEARIDYSGLTMLDQDAVRVEWTQSWTHDEDETTQIESDVKMLQSDLKALMATYTRISGDQEWRFEGNYTGENLIFGAYYPGDATREEAMLSRGGRFCDTDILPFLLRNIPFADGNFITLTTVDVKSHSFITPIASIMGSEIVETANTQYDCWVVTVSLGSEGFTAFYSKTDTHFLVKVRYSDRELVLNHHS